MLPKLPIGIQNLNEILTGGYIYIDKTEHALNLINRYKYVFLSRPRRFGKSLFIDTLYEIFTGNKELFKGLYIYDKYDFEPYPVIRISWGGDFSTQESTIRVANDVLKVNQERLGIDCENLAPDICFRELIRKSYEKYGKKVVVLIDEYDKPILDNIAKVEEAHKRREFLRGLYVQMKENDAYIRFVFLTGISKFSKASIFSGLNNLVDITLNKDFATICGYTQHDIETDFSELLKGTDLAKVKEWYNGYNFLGDHVYNPFDILQFIDNGFMFKSYWWSSGTPFSLVQLLKSGDYYIPELQNLRVSEVQLESFEIEQLRLETLLFQAGYLTIDHIINDEFLDHVEYKLRVPNKEVQISLNQLFFLYLTGKDYRTEHELLRNMYYGKIDYLKDVLQRLFSSIPYNNYVKNNISTYEGYYSSVVYSFLSGIGVKVLAEDVTDRGRIDLTMFIREKVYIIEFKVGEGSALEQIKHKRYWEKYQGQGEIYIIGINFDEKERNVTKLEWEIVS